MAKIFRLGTLGVCEGVCCGAVFAPSETKNMYATTKRPTVIANITNAYIPPAFPAILTASINVEGQRLTYAGRDNINTLHTAHFSLIAPCEYELLNIAAPVFEDAIDDATARAVTGLTLRGTKRLNSFSGR